MTNQPIQKPADTAAELHPLIAKRWSPRIFDSSHQLSDNETTSIAEAFRWAPSSSNQQPWHLVILRKGNELHEQVSEVGLNGFNRAWASTASAYAIVLADTLHEGEIRDRAETFYDAGLASAFLALQTEALGLRAHFMGGINRDEIAEIVGAVNREVICVAAIGMQGTLENQSDELIKREQQVRTRKAPAEIYSVDSKID